jgi:hypothetical protein
MNGLVPNSASLRRANPALVKAFAPLTPVVLRKIIGLWTTDYP